MPSEELTPAAISVELRNIYSLLENMSKNMVSKDLFEAKFDSNNERVKRLEFEQREWAEKSTQAHVELDRDSKARHAESNALAEKIRAELQHEIDKAGQEAKDAKRDAEQNRRTRFNGFIAAGLAFASALILKFFVPDIP